jgi:hypothetical protein
MRKLLRHTQMQYVGKMQIFLMLKQLCLSFKGSTKMQRNLETFRWYAYTVSPAGSLLLKFQSVLLETVHNVPISPS